MKSMATGEGMARIRSAMKTAAPFSTPTRSGTPPRCSCEMDWPSSTTRAAISSREMSTPPGRWGMGRRLPASVLLGRDEGGQRALAAHAIGDALGLGLALEGADAHTVVRLPVARRGGRHVGIEPGLLELLLEGLGLGLRLERGDLHRPRPRRLRSLVAAGGRIRVGGLLDDGLAPAPIGIRRWCGLASAGFRRGERLRLLVTARSGIRGASAQWCGEGLVEGQLLIDGRLVDVASHQAAALPRRDDLSRGAVSEGRGGRTSPLPAHEDAKGEGESHDHGDRAQETDPLEPGRATSHPPSPRHACGLHMLSGAETPRSSRPFRTTCPTAAARPRRATVSARSSVITRWNL